LSGMRKTLMMVLRVASGTYTLRMVIMLGQNTPAGGGGGGHGKGGGG
jgi:hypothetical protein